MLERGAHDSFPFLLRSHLLTTDIKDMAVDDESIFVLHSDGVSTEHFLYVTPLESLSHFIRISDWKNAVLAFEESHALLGRGIVQSVTMSQLQELMEGARFLPDLGAERFRVLQDVYEEMRRAFSVQEAQRMQEDGQRDGIVTVTRRPGIGVYATTPHAEVSQQVSCADPAAPHAASGDGAETEEGSFLSASPPLRHKKHKKRVVDIGEMDPSVDACAAPQNAEAAGAAEEVVAVADAAGAVSFDESDLNMDEMGAFVGGGGGDGAGEDANGGNDSVAFDGFEAPGLGSIIQGLRVRVEEQEESLRAEHPDLVVPERSDDVTSTTPTAHSTTSSSIPWLAEEEEEQQQEGAAAVERLASSAMSFTELDASGEVVANRQGSAASSSSSVAWLEVTPQSPCFDFLAMLEAKKGRSALAQDEGISIATSRCAGWVLRRADAGADAPPVKQYLVVDLRAQTMRFQVDESSTSSAKHTLALPCDSILVVVGSPTDARFSIETRKMTIECEASSRGAQALWVALLHYASVCGQELVVQAERK